MKLAKYLISIFIILFIASLIATLVDKVIVTSPRISQSEMVPPIMSSLLRSSAGQWLQMQASTEKCQDSYKRTAIKSENLWLFCPASGGAAIIAKDNQSVYFAGRPIEDLVYDSSGNVLAKRTPDPATFTPIDAIGLYGVDADHAWALQNENSPLIDKADAKTFYTNNSLLPFATDARHIFVDATTVTEADPTSFHMIRYNSDLGEDHTSEWAADKKQVFWLPPGGGRIYFIISGADSASFTPINSYCGRDRTDLFCSNKRCASSTLENIQSATDCQAD